MSQHRNHGKNKPQSTSHPGNGPQNVRLDIKYGHSESHIVIVYNRKVENVSMTPAEVDEMIHALQETKKMLAAHQAKAAANG